ncbi:SCP2 sterol-binding domain-containing protein [Parasitella parasitica]|nr:SCP2 sterol-binding domain-containing protein [Parasitella parasitica]
MSDIVVPGFKSSELIADLSKAFDGFSSEERAKLVKQVNGVFQFVIKNSEGKEEIFTVDVKKEGKVVRGKGNVKADAILTLKDGDFVDLATGKLNGQKAYMSGKLKIKGQIMLAMKLDNVFKAVNPTAKL